MQLKYLINIYTGDGKQLFTKTVAKTVAKTGIDNIDINSDFYYTIRKQLTVSWSDFDRFRTGSNVAVSSRRAIR